MIARLGTRRDDDVDAGLSSATASSGVVAVPSVMTWRPRTPRARARRGRRRRS